MGAPRTVRDLPDAILGAGLLAGGANVIMQLARPAVGHGVVESPVGTGSLVRHPVKRTRTTVTYLAVAVFGTDEERTAYRRAVDDVHARVRSTWSSPVRYHALDPALQLWVAACLYRGVEDVYRAFVGPIEGPAAERIYRASSVFGTTLQVREDMWPADRAAFERYWAGAMDEVAIDDTVRRYLRDITDLRFLPSVLRGMLGPVHRFVTTGFLRPRFRDEMRLPWSPRRQWLFERLVALIGVLVRRSPRPLRQFPYNASLWDLRRRMRLGRPLV